MYSGKVVDFRRYQGHAVGGRSDRNLEVLQPLGVPLRHVRSLSWALAARPSRTIADGPSRTVPAHSPRRLTSSRLPRGLSVARSVEASSGSANRRSTGMRAARTRHGPLAAQLITSIRRAAVSCRTRPKIPVHPRVGINHDALLPAADARTRRRGNARAMA